MIEQKIDPPQPRFLSSCYILFSNYACAFSEKISWMQVKLESVEEKM